MKKLKLTKKDVIYLVIIGVLVLGIAALTVVLIVGRKTETAHGDYYAEKCESYRVQNANLSKGQIVFIGDSITDLYPLDDYYADLPLAVYNRGIGGDTTQGVLDRLQVSLFDLAPKKIVLLIGINDINGGIGVDIIADNYSRILGEIKKNLPSAEVYCMSTLPMNDTILTYAPLLDLSGQNGKVVSLNVKIKALAEEQGYVFVDLYERATDGEGKLKQEYSIDGIHLSAAGFAVWAETVKARLAQ